MTDNKVLLTVVLILYLSECLFWVKTGGLAFVKNNHFWKIVFPSNLFGNKNGGLALAYPLPTLGRAFISCLIPISFTDKGILNYSSETLLNKTPVINDIPVFVSYKDIVSIKSKGSEILINEDVFCVCGSYLQSKMLVEIIEQIRKQPKKSLAVIKELLNSIFNVSQITLLAESLELHTKSLIILCNFQLITMFFIAPLLVYILGSNLLIFIFIFVYLVNIAIMVMYYLSHKKLYLEDVSERITDIAKMFFCPPFAIRAVDLISLRLFSCFHPLAVAYSFLSEDDFKAFTKRALLLYRYKSTTTEDNGYTHHTMHHLSSMEKAVEGFLLTQNITLDNVEAPPDHSIEELSYCPRCHASFTKSIGECSECKDVTLIAYKGGVNGQS